MDIPAVNHCMFPPSYTASAGAPAVGYRMHSGPQKAVRPACTITLRSRGEDQILPIQQILYAEIFDHDCMSIRWMVRPIAVAAICPHWRSSFPDALFCAATAAILYICLM